MTAAVAVDGNDDVFAAGATEQIPRCHDVASGERQRTRRVLAVDEPVDVHFPLRCTAAGGQLQDVSCEAP
jgi:hypothetical protein